MRNVAVNRGIRLSFWDSNFISFGKIHRSGTAGLYNCSIFNFPRNLQAVSNSGCTLLHPHQQRTSVLFSLHSNQHLLPLVFSIIDKCEVIFHCFFEHVPSLPRFLPSSFFFISFPNYFDIFIYTSSYVCYVLCVLSHSFMSVSLQPWTVVHQASQIVQWPKSEIVWKKFLDWPAHYYCGGLGWGVWMLVVGGRHSQIHMVVSMCRKLI